MLNDNEVSSMRKVRNELIIESGAYCWCCGKNFAPSLLQGHHIIPQAQGGQTCKSNIAILCDQCHKDKHKLIQQGNWKKYDKAMKKVVYNGNERRKYYAEFIKKITIKR